MKMLKYLFLANMLLAGPASAQWQVPNHSVPVGKGGGAIGFGGAAPGSAGQPLISNGPTSDPSFQVLPNAGLANAPANTVKCNPTGSAAAVQDCTGIIGASSVKTANYTAQNADCGGRIYLGGNALFNLAVNAANTYTLGCHLSIQNIDAYAGPGTGRGKIMIINGVTQHPLYPGQKLDIDTSVDGTTWIPRQQVNGALGQFWFLANAPVFFVDPAGGSDANNDGLASGAANAFKTLGQCIVVVGQAQVTRNGSTTFCKVTAGSSITEHVNILYYIQAPIPLQIQSTINGTPFTWNCPAATTCVLLGDYGNSQFQDINFVMADNPIVFQHQYGIFETLSNVTMTGNNGGFPLITCDTNSQLNIDAGFTYAGTASLVFNACPGSFTQFNGTIAGSGGASIGRFFNAQNRAGVLFQGNVTFTGTAPGSASLATGNSVIVNLSGATIPGGNPTPGTGAQYCSSPC